MRLPETMRGQISDEDLNRLLAGGLILDGPAADILDKRGFGAKIGLREIQSITQRDELYSIEECTDAEFSLRKGAQINVNTGGCHNSLAQGRLLPDTLVISRLLDPKQREVGHGVVLFENELGGRVTVFPFDVDKSVHLSPQRFIQMRRVVAWLSRENQTGMVDGNLWLVPIFLCDERNHRAVVFNAGFDAVSRKQFHSPQCWPKWKEAFHLNAEGEITSADINNNELRTAQPVHQWEVIIALA
jgi:hypothetical protein